jgi:serine phosphatase RsbU (regulator of sigma subunit)
VSAVAAAGGRRRGPPRALVAIGALDLLLPGPTTLMALLVAVPALAVLRPGSPHLPGVVALATIGVAAPLGVMHWAERPVAVSTSLAGTVVTSVVAWIACRRHERGVHVREGLRRVAEVAQRAVLRPVPPCVGPVHARVRYLAADAEAKVGGDLYDIVDTPFGVRAIMGDAMGKGLAAVEKAADVLGAFRELAWTERDVADVAARLDAFLAAQGGDEEFVTAVLVEIPPGGAVARVVNRGHPPPLVTSAGGVATFADGAGCAAGPPLGLWRMVGGAAPSEAVLEIPFGPGDRLLLYTDGASEARDAQGRFYPLPERVVALDDGDPETLLTLLENDLRAHADDRLGDDAALLVIRLDAGGPDPPPAGFEVLASAASRSGDPPGTGPPRTGTTGRMRTARADRAAEPGGPGEQGG